MATTARSLATMLLLALTISIGSASGAAAQAAPGGCGVPATPADPTPGVPGAVPAIPADPTRCAPGPDGVLGTADDVPLVLSAGTERFPLRADTGAGGMMSEGPEGTLLLLSGGLLALGAAFGLRRAARSSQS